MHTYLITGVAGFVGKYFVRYLQNIEPDAKITGVDIISTCPLPIQYYQMDLNNFSAIKGLITKEKPDYIVHLAAISSVGESWKDPTSCFLNNTTILLNLLNSVRECNLKTRVLSTGSSEEYALSDKPLTEDMPLNPLNPYGVAKVSQEMIGKLYAESLDVDVVMTRSFNHIGPGQNERFVVPSFIKQLFDISNGAENKMLVGNIEVARDFTDVRDVIDAYYKILHHAPKGSIYNVCSGKAIELKQIIEIAQNILGIKANIIIDPARIRPNDVMVIQGSNEKLKKELNWQPQYTIEQTIKDIIFTIKG